MTTIAQILQVVIALGIVNVWLIRFNKKTAYRGGEANNMAEEFAAYGLPPWTMKATGAAKLVLAALLVAGIWFTQLATISAAAMALLMIGAIAMHVRVKDPLSKSLPALGMLVMSIIVFVAYS